MKLLTPHETSLINGGSLMTFTPLIYITLKGICLHYATGVRYKPILPTIVLVDLFDLNGNINWGAAGGNVGLLGCILAGIDNLPYPNP